MYMRIVHVCIMCIKVWNFKFIFYQPIFKVSPSSFLEYINRFVFLKKQWRYSSPIFDAASINFQFHRDKVRSRG